MFFQNFNQTAADSLSTQMVWMVEEEKNRARLIISDANDGHDV